MLVQAAIDPDSPNTTRSTRHQAARKAVLARHGVVVNLVLRRGGGVVGPYLVGRQGLTGVRHRVSLTGKSLGNEKLGRAGQFRPQGFRLPFEAVGVVRSALHEGTLATLF